ncbi:MAG: electron transport complex subunit RsxE [Ndongobacter sp.]|nr:electron transport complex subunit RsxE [Ndongobacter sp.]
MKISEQFKEGLFSNNPVLVQLIGLCSVLAVSSSVMGAVGMGLSVIVVLTCSNVVISLLRNFIPNEVRIPAFIVVIASFVTLLQMLLEAFVPALNATLGIFLPLIVVNCIILGRAEAFASKQNVFRSFIDGIANGLGYTMTISIIAVVRELLGAGTLMGLRIIPEEATLPFLTQAPSAFMLVGTLIAISVALRERNKKKGAA